MVLVNLLHAIKVGNGTRNAEDAIVTAGRQVLLGGNDKYIAMCHGCFINRIREEEKNANQ